MATSTTRLGLRKPVGADTVQVALDISASMDTIDNSMGLLAVTSSTRPSSPYNGQQIRETDTGLTQYYNGSAWKAPSVPVVSALSQIPSPYTGQLAFLTAGSAVYVWTGSAWALFYAKEYSSNQIATATPTITSGNSATLASVAITDPGYAYKVFVSADVDVQFSTGGGFIVLNAQNNTATFGSAVMSSSRALSPGSANFKVLGSIPFQTDNATYTGNRTIYLVAQANSGDATAWGNTGSFQITIKPVTP